jgi:hypothetical protein
MIDGLTESNPSITLCRERLLLVQSGYRRLQEGQIGSRQQCEYLSTSLLLMKTEANVDVISLPRAVQIRLTLPGAIAAQLGAIH